MTRQGKLVDRCTFFQHLRQSRLLTDEQVRQAEGRFSTGQTGHAIAAALVAEGLLTTFQARHVCSGEVHRLHLGQYRLVEELGRGGMGQVYKALHTIMGRIVAIKVISPELVKNDLAVEWFRREVRASTQLEHPNIVMAYDANEADGLHFLVMEYVDGVTLDSLVRQNGPLPVPRACELMRQAALALQYAHEQGMVHRDIKPANLLVLCRESGKADAPAVKIVDFGLARLQGQVRTDTIMLHTEHAVVGTPDYISPEQSRSIHAADIRSDLYSLGCTFYHALTGRVPFPGDTVMEKLVKVLTEDPPPLERMRPDVPRPVAAIIRRLMAKNPADRYQTPADLARDLERWCGQAACPPVGGDLSPQGWDEPPDATRLPPNVPATNVLERIELFRPDRPARCSESEAPAVGSKTVVTVAPALADAELNTAPDSASDLDAPWGMELVAAAAPTSSPPAAPTAPAPAPRSIPPTSQSASPLTIPPALRTCWRRWTAVVETYAQRHGRHGLRAEEYRVLHQDLLQACRAAAVTAPLQARDFFQRMEAIARPWLNLQTFRHTESSLLKALLVRCQEVEWELNGRRNPRNLGRFIGIFLLLLCPAGVGAWYGWAGHHWLPVLLRRLGWDDPDRASLYSIGLFLQTHATTVVLGLVAAIVLFSVYLIARPGSRVY
jgi:serine/threonine protein kinase